MSTPPKTFTETTSFRALDNNSYETIHFPERLGNAANIAYGGFALAAAIRAATLSVPATYFLYTIQGAYLGPALTDRPLHATTHTIRQTRTFATRRIDIFQTQDSDTQPRACLTALADFQVDEPALLEYSVSPSKPYSGPQGLGNTESNRQQKVREGKISKEMADAHRKTFGVLDRFFDLRPCPEGIFYHNLTGMAKTLPTPQDGLPLTAKTSADWVRSLHALPTYADQLSNLGFLMDGALSFAPLAYSGMFLDDAGAVSSLDFSLRVFTRGVRMEEWGLKEVRVRVGREGRGFAEAWLFDGEGRAVACMSQQSIVRRGSGGKGVVRL
ncbi:hypothetical protein EJ04DRAFT_552063 [Polyplosphaeria fusca]|uniref:Thioesterase-like superfamily-domain-containing protein n=1 Tax=Polyplosphaeria fusca TaxID=682080 RepID=A0A9P4QX29_9PLEO|nr:hypothetical protein EJ04DRAFT_552063 [Polyplosphaeria fusca]